MFTNALAGAIDAAHPKQFDFLSRQLWQAHAAGHIADQDAQTLAERPPDINTAKSEFREAWKALKARTPPAYRAMNIRGDG